MEHRDEEVKKECCQDCRYSTGTCRSNICSCHNSQPVVPEWEKEFEKQMSHLNWKSCTCCQRAMDFKKIIHKLLREVRNQTLEEAAEAATSELLKKAREIDYADSEITEYDEAAGIVVTTIRSLKS